MQESKSFVAAIEIDPEIHLARSSANDFFARVSGETVKPSLTSRYGPLGKGLMLKASGLLKKAVARISSELRRARSVLKEIVRDTALAAIGEG